MSNTEIELEYPYSDIWKKGYIVINKEDRKTLILYNSTSDRSSTQYARYLLAVKLGRFLEKHEHVDHIDNDKTNNKLENLQILSFKENNIKSHKKPNVNLKCPVCSKHFSRTHSQLRGRKHKIENNLIACSRSCGGKLGFLLSSKTKEIYG